MAVTVVGFPARPALLVRLLVPGAGRLLGRSAVTAVLVVVLIMGCWYALGSLHPRLLTCEDIMISGDFAPAGCTQGTGTSLS